MPERSYPLRTVRPVFSLPSILAIICAVGSFMAGAAWGLILAIAAIVLGAIGLLLAFAPGVRGGFASVLSIIAGALGILAAIVKILF